MTQYLFTYGTLLPERAPDEIAGAVAKLRRVGAGRVRGVLYGLGEYPGAVLDEHCGSEVEGTVFELPEEPSILRRLDEYEEFDPNAPEGSLFRRISRAVTLDTGETLSCWIYVYNRDPAGMRMLPGGSSR